MFYSYYLTYWDGYIEVLIKQHCRSGVEHLKYVKMILCLLLLFICPCQSQDLKGLKFEDNLLEARFGPENGYAVYDTGL